MKLLVYGFFILISFKAFSASVQFKALLLSSPNAVKGDDDSSGNLTLQRKPDLNLYFSDKENLSRINLYAGEESEIYTASVEEKFLIFQEDANVTNESGAAPLFKIENISSFSKIFFVVIKIQSEVKIFPIYLTELNFDSTTVNFFNLTNKPMILSLGDNRQSFNPSELIRVDLKINDVGRMAVAVFDKTWKVVYSSRFYRKSTDNPLMVFYEPMPQRYNFSRINNF